MGTDKVNPRQGAESSRQFTKHLLSDLRALEQMLNDGMFEDMRRIGAEQELFLVDRAWRPAPRSEEVLAALDDPYFTTELARFNLEFNLDPLLFGDDCLRQLESELDRRLAQVSLAANRLGLHVLLTGILPTLAQSDLGLENMASNPRYALLNDAFMRLRGRDYEFSIKGTDELTLSHDSLMPEACNTSFQVHFQVAPHEFAKLYNIAQITLGPVLAAATNSPLLFGQRLWRETRVAVFQQALDTRSSGHHDRSPRVSFGRQWLDTSVLEIFKEDIARFRVLLSCDADDDPFAVLASGGVPVLSALRLHNGTIYRWNRPCYGISNGKPHLRIENRVLPAGPTVLDEVANAAFWFGLMGGLSDTYDDITRRMDFDDAKSNFVSAARVGLDAHLSWIDGRPVAARELICDELLPMARAGLLARAIDGDDVDRYLGVIEQRVATGRTGSQWALESLTAMKDVGTRFERLSSLAAGTIARQREGAPVHEWPLASLGEGGGWRQHYARVDQIMQTDLFTVHQDDLIDLAAALMEWEHVRYVLVENDEDRLVGLVSLRTLLRLVGQDLTQHTGQPTPVSAVMHANPKTVTPDTPTLEAIRLMKDERIGCLPVVKDGRLVGLVTDRTFVHVVKQLLEKTLHD